ncbi:MAG: prepilin-type N-terminal cleavage/methylation protein [Ramlibacter sp.]|jgi:type IV pilus assembly protein PilW|uniref:PilW family protein n=1 Tax=Ramlibacter sp. TaxID=1917967 RepID=UPI0026185F6C|nr:PilW family protein [Ramlibacter sp.]MDB5753336.1 prepilin-type N-terminal cleavage/methylation protein [Ramlibacter sp.]
MCSPHPSADRARQAGFTLIELMIGVVIGLLASLAVTHVLVNSEGQKRTTMAGSDAQINGALSLSTLQRSIQSAGYGFAATPMVIGCPISARWNNAVIAGFPASLVPVTITDGAAGAPDTVRVLASGKTSFSVPGRIIPPGYAAGAKTVPIASIRGIQTGDLMLAASDASAICEMFQVTGDPPDPTNVRRDDDARWNPPNWPTASYGQGNFLVNLGSPVDTTYSIVNNALRVSRLNLAAADTQPSYEAVELFPDIVNLQALYGKDTDNDGAVDTWNNVTPVNNAGWLQVMAVRLAVVARSSQFEKADVTFANPLWDVGTIGTTALTGLATCGASKCLTLKVETVDAGWKRYRYRVFDTVIPLRNMLWNS